MGLSAPASTGEYLNNVVEADHGKLKQLIRPVQGSSLRRIKIVTRPSPHGTQAGRPAKISPLLYREVIHQFGILTRETHKPTGSSTSELP
jgi:hypothetical protein